MTECLWTKSGVNDSTHLSLKPRSAAFNMKNKTSSGQSVFVGTF